MNRTNKRQKYQFNNAGGRLVGGAQDTDKPAATPEAHAHWKL